MDQILFKLNPETIFGITHQGVLLVCQHETGIEILLISRFGRLNALEQKVQAVKCCNARENCDP